MNPLSTKRRSELRSEAHRLDPIVLIGDKGLTDEVLAEIDRSLKAHELIKVRAAGGERDARGAWLEAICEKLQAHPVQQIGKVFVIFRENPEAPEPEGGRRKPAAGAAQPAEDRRRTRASVVTERGKLRQHSRDLDKRRESDVKDMVRKGKIKPKAESGSAIRQRGDDTSEESSTRTSRPRSRAAAVPAETAARRRRARS